MVRYFITGLLLGFIIGVNLVMTIVVLHGDRRKTMRATKLIIAEIIKTVTKLSELIEQREILRERSTEE